MTQSVTGRRRHVIWVNEADLFEGLCAVSSNRPRNGICLITFPYDLVYPGPKTLLHVFRSIFPSVLLISGKSANLENIPRVSTDRMILPSWVWNLPSLLRFLYIEIAALKKVRTILDRVSVAVVYECFAVLSSLLARICGTRIISFVGGSGFRSEISRGESFLHRLKAYVTLWLERVSWMIAGTIVILSRTTIGEAGLKKYQNKLAISANFPDPHFYDDFKCSTALLKRKPVVGFVGRLEAEKGIAVFVRAIPLILERRPDARFIIVGDGSLKPWVENQLAHDCLLQKVELTGFVNHKMIGKYLNRMKLLILPSSTEGVPHIILEAQACGTPVLATPVGGVPELISDGETGFLVRKPDALLVSDATTRLLNNPESLMRVSKSALSIVRDSYDFRSLVRNWRMILA